MELIFCWIKTQAANKIYKCQVMKSYMEKNWQSWIEKVGITYVYVYNFKS